MFFGRFVTRNPAGVNLMFALVGLLTYSVFYAFPAYRPVAKCVKNFPKKDGTYSNRHCFGFAPNSLFTRLPNNRQSA
jgi:hypothetical protein